MRDRISKVKDHLKENKTVYLVGTGGVIVGALTVLAFTQRVSVSQKAKNVGLVNWKPVNNLEQTTVVQLPARGHRGSALFCNETKELFASQREAAKTLGINQGNISSYLKGKNTNAGGYTFQDLGENLSEEVRLSM